jgi:GNAT superfamily N-acetyltransferase
MPDIKLRIATKHAESNVKVFTNIINEVYIESEGNIWIDEYRRITKNELINIIRTKELLIAVNKDVFCGCIHLERVDNQRYKFKMLVTNPKLKGKGIGSKLVKFAEQQAKNYGASVMQLELLVPTEFIHPDKEFLRDWYTRIGYKKIAEYDIDYVHQGISKFLKTGCVAKVYEKKID